VIDTPAVGGAAARPPRHLTPRRGGLAALLFVLLISASAARGHGTPIQLEFWGDFPPNAARCQRAIGRAAATCALRAWRLRRDCAMTRLQGGACDEDAVERAIVSARFDAQDVVAAYCTTPHLNILQFTSLSEAQIDVTSFCRDLEDAAVSLLLDPLAGGVPPGSATCIDGATRVASKLFGNGFRSRQRLLDRIAGAPFSVPTKREMRDASTAEISAAASALGAQMARRCAPAQFAALYHQQSPEEVVAKLTSRADCLAGQAYAQAGVVCPVAECGNRMIERDEECDDGNAVGGDRCSATCLRE